MTITGQCYPTGDWRDCPHRSPGRIPRRSGSPLLDFVAGREWVLGPRCCCCRCGRKAR